MISAERTCDILDCFIIQTLVLYTVNMETDEGENKEIIEGPWKPSNTCSILIKVTTVYYPPMIW